MTRFGADVRHVRSAVPCTAKTRNRTDCKSTTNYVCADCGRGLCGRHQDERHAADCRRSA